MINIATLGVTFSANTGPFDAAVRNIENELRRLSALNPTITINANTTAARTAINNLNTAISGVQTNAGRTATLRVDTAAAQTNVAALNAQLTSTIAAMGRLEAAANRAGAAMPRMAAGATRGFQQAHSAGLGFLGILERVAAFNLADRVVDFGLKEIEAGFIEFNSIMDSSQMVMRHFAENGLDPAIDGMERMATATQMAKDHLEDIKQFALETPFQFRNLVQFDSQAQGMGFSQKQSMAMLQAVGDQAAAMGQGDAYVGREVANMGKMLALGHASGMEIRELSRAGVNAIDALIEHYAKFGKTLTEQDIQKMLRDKVIPANEALSAFFDKMEERNKGLMQEQVKTFQGAMSNIKDVIQQSTGDLTKPIFDAFRDTIITVSEAMQKADFKKIMLDAAAGFAELIDNAKNFYQEHAQLINQLVSGGAAFAAAASAILGMNSAVTVLSGGINALLALNPELLALAATAGIIAAAWASDFDGLKDPIELAFGDIVASVHTFFDYLSGQASWDDFVASANNAFDTVQLVAQATADDLIPVFKQMGTDSWDAFEKEFKNKQGTFDASKFIQRLEQTPPTVVNPSSQAGIELHNSIVNNASQLFQHPAETTERINEFFRDVKSSVHDQAVELYKQFFIVGTDIYTEFFKGLDSAGDVAKDFYTNFFITFDNVMDGLGTFKDNIGTKAEEIQNAWTDFFTHSGDAVSQGVSDIIKKLQEDFINFIRDTILKDLSDILSGKGVDVFTRWMDNIRKALTEGLPSIGAQLNDFIQNTVMDWVNRLGSVGNTIRGAIQGWFDGMGSISSSTGGINGGIYGPSFTSGSTALGEVPNQFVAGMAIGLTEEQAATICGPLAAQALANQFGKNIPLDQAIAVAKKYGYVLGGQMSGPSNEAKVVQELTGLPAIYKPASEGNLFDTAKNLAQSGQYVAVSTQKHYYVVQGYDASKGGFLTGNTGQILKDYPGVGNYISLSDMDRMGGGIQGLVYVQAAANAAAQQYQDMHENILSDMSAPAQPSARDVLNGRIAARNSAEDAKQINLAEQSEIFKKRVDDTKKRINDALAASKITKEKYNELMQTLNNAYQEAMHSGRGAERKYTEVIKEAYPISIGSEAERASNQAIQNLLGLSTTGAYNYNEVFNASGATIVDPAKAAKDAEKAKKKAEAEAKKNDQRIKTENSAVNAYIKQMDDLIKRDFPNMKSPERERIIASMLSIAKHESGLIPNNIQKDENGNPLGGYGLFQIDVKKGVYAGMPGQPFLDPTTNINAAYEGYFKKMIKKGGRSAADFYWMPGIGINSAATHGALDEELAKNEQDFLGLAKVSSTLIADDGKKGSKKTDTGDPFQHGLQLIQSGSQALKALSTNYNPSDVRNVEPFFDDMKQLAEAMANASDGIDDIINKADNIDAFTTLSLHAVEVISKGTDAFNKLYDLIPPQPEDFKRFFDANDTLIAYITDRSSNIAEDLPAQAETYVTVVGDALAVISQGVKDFNDLAMSYTVQPEQIDAFFTNIDATVERYKVGLGSVDKDLLDQSGQYLRVVSDASLTISKAADAFKNMWMGAMVDPAQIDAFINNLTQIIHRFGEAQSTLTPELERDAKNFSNTVGKVTSGVKTGVEALNALWTLYPIDTSSIDQFVGDVLTIVNKFSDAEKALGSDPAAKAQLRLSAQTFAKLTDEVTKPIKTGVDAINALWTMMPVDINAVDQFTENIKLVAQKYNEGVKSLGGAGQANILVQTSTLFSQIVDSSTKGMSSGIEGLNKLWTLIKPDTQSVNAFVDSIIMVATKFAEVGPKVRPISLQAEEFAKVAQAVTGPIGSGVDNLSKVWRLEKPSEKQIDELTNSLFMVSDKFAQAMKRFTDQHDPQRAQQFATAAKAVTDVLAPTIAGFESLRRYIKPKDGIFEAIADQLSSLTSAFADKAINFQPSQLVQVKQFMDAAKPVIDAIKDFAELADKLRLYKSRSLPLAEIKEQMVGMFNLFADMFQDNENPTYSHTQLVQVMEFADANKKVMDAFTGAIATADKLMNYIKPNLSKMSGINELMKSAMSQMIGLMNGFDYGNEGRQGVEDAASFAEQMSKILGPIATSMDIANKLVDYIKPNENALKSVRQLMQREVQEFLLLAKDYPDGLDPQIEKFAQTIGAIFNPIKTAIDTFNALSDFVAPNSSRITAVISSIKSTLSQFLEELMPFADKLQQEGDRGKGLAALGSMLEVLSKGTGSLNQITDLVLPKPEKIQQSVTALHDTLLSVVPLMRQFASENMGGDNFSPEYFQKQMQATGSTLEVLVKGLAVFEKLNSLPNINRSTVDRLIADTQYAAKEVFQAVSELINDNVDLKLTAKAADAASKSMDVLTKAIEAFSKLNSYVSPPTRLYHVIAQDIKMASTEIVAGLTGLDIADGMDKKISAASNSVKAIGDAIGVFMKLNDITDGKGKPKAYQGVNQKALQAIVGDISKAVPMFNEMMNNIGFGPGDDEAVTKKSQALNNFSSTVNNIMSAINAFSGVAKDQVSGSHIKNTIGLFLQTVKGLVSDLIDFTNKTPDGQLERVQSMMTSISSLLNGFAQIAGNLKGQNSNGIFAIMQHMRTAINEFILNIVSMANDDRVQEALDHLNSIFENMFDVMRGDLPFQAGADLGKQIAAGIESQIPAIQAAIEKALQGADLGGGSGSGSGLDDSGVDAEGFIGGSGGGTVGPTGSRGGRKTGLSQGRGLASRLGDSHMARFFSQIEQRASRKYPGLFTGNAQYDYMMFNAAGGDESLMTGLGTAPGDDIYGLGDLAGRLAPGNMPGSRAPNLANPITLYQTLFNSLWNQDDASLQQAGIKYSIPFYGDQWMAGDNEAAFSQDALITRMYLNNPTGGGITKDQYDAAMKRMQTGASAYGSTPNKNQARSRFINAIVSAMMGGGGRSPISGEDSPFIAGVIGSAAPGAGGKLAGLPGFAKGGIPLYNMPMPIMVGDGGEPEAVVPMSQAGTFAAQYNQQSSVSSTGPSHTTMNLIIDGKVIGQIAVDYIRREIRQTF